jgi:hypothetical protein
MGLAWRYCLWLEKRAWLLLYAPRLSRHRREGVRHRVVLWRAATVRFGQKV